MIETRLKSCTMNKNKIVKMITCFCKNLLDNNDKAENHLIDSIEVKTKSNFIIIFKSKQHIFQLFLFYSFTKRMKTEKMA